MKVSLKNVRNRIALNQSHSEPPRLTRVSINAGRNFFFGATPQHTIVMIDQQNSAIGRAANHSPFIAYDNSRKFWNSLRNYMPLAASTERKQNRMPCDIFRLLQRLN